MLKLEIPMADVLRESAVGCSGCGKVAPFTLSEFEAGQVALGWQLRVFATETERDGELAREWRWDVFCPDCATNPPDPEVPFLRIRRR